MPERIRRNRGLARPENPANGALPAHAAMAAREGRCQQLQCTSGLLGDYTVAEGGELSRTSEPWGGGDPAGLKALHPLHEVGTKSSGRVGGRRCGTGQRLPSVDGARVCAPSLACVPDSGDECVQSGRTAADEGGRQPLPDRRAGASLPLPLWVGSSDAAALARVKSPLPCRWLGEPLVPSDAVGVGSSHSTSSAKFGPCPPDFRFEGCWEPPFFPRLLVGVLSRVVGGPGSEEGALATMRGSDVRGAKHAPPRVVPEVGQGAEYGTKCSQRRLGWIVSQTPRAELHVARGAGGCGEESSDIFDHHQAGAEGFDRTGDVQPQPGAGVGVQSGTTAGNRDVFDRGSPPSGRTPAERRTSR